MGNVGKVVFFIAGLFHSSFAPPVRDARNYQQFTRDSLQVRSGAGDNPWSELLSENPVVNQLLGIVKVPSGQDFIDIDNEVSQVVANPWLELLSSALNKSLDISKVRTTRFRTIPINKTDFNFSDVDFEHLQHVDIPWADLLSPAVNKSLDILKELPTRFRHMAINKTDFNFSDVDFEHLQHIAQFYLERINILMQAFESYSSHYHQPILDSIGGDRVIMLPGQLLDRDAHTRSLTRQDDMDTFNDDELEIINDIHDSRYDLKTVLSVVLSSLILFYTLYIITCSSRQQTNVEKADLSIMTTEKKTDPLNPVMIQTTKNTYKEFCENPYTYRSITVASPYHVFVTVKNETLLYNLFRYQQFQESKTIRFDNSDDIRSQVKSFIARIAPNASFNVHLQDSKTMKISEI